MPNTIKTELNLREKPGLKGRSVLQWIRRNAATEIAVALALAIAAYFLGRHLFDLAVPGEGDVIKLSEALILYFSFSFECYQSDWGSGCNPGRSIFKPVPPTL